MKAVRDAVYAAVCLLLLVSCSEKEALNGVNPAVLSPLPDASEKRPLRWMGHWKGEGKRERLVNEIREDFCYTHPQLDVSFRFASDILPEKSQLAAAEYISGMIRSGNYEWDVIWFDSLIYQYVADELGDWDWGDKYLVDFVGRPAVENRHKAALVEGEDLHRFTGGILPGPYIEGFYYSLWYNRERAKQLGLDLNVARVSDADLLAYTERLSGYNRNAEEPVALFVDFNQSGSLTRLVQSLICSLKHRGTSLDAVAATNRVAALFEEMVQLAGTNALVLEADSWPEAARALMEGRALFFCDATWRYNGFEEVDPEGLKKLGLAPTPEFEEGCHHAIGGYISTWAVFKNAPGCAEGIELMEYWSRPAIAEKWIRYTKSPTGLTGSLYDPLFGGDMFADYQRRMAAPNRHFFLDPIVFREGLATEKKDDELSVEDILRGTEPSDETEDR